MRDIEFTGDPLTYDGLQDAVNSIIDKIVFIFIQHACFGLSLVYHLSFYYLVFM